MAAVRELFDIAVFVLWVVVIVKVVKKPASSWNHGWFGKIGSILVVLFVYTTFWGWFLPWGALVVWWRRLGRQRDDFELPMADGRKKR